MSFSQLLMVWRDTYTRCARSSWDIPASARMECFVVPLVMSATSTADELSRAATCRGIENPARSTDTERLRMRAVDWAVLALAVGTALWGGAY